jgi:PEP phosphonomutase and related enzymes
MAGKSVEAPEVLEAKIATAVATRQHDDFLIMSRTDARAVYGLDDAIARSHRYQDAGADMVFIEAPRNREELVSIHEAFPTTPLMANMIRRGCHATDADGGPATSRVPDCGLPNGDDVRADLCERSLTPKPAGNRHHPEI